jgi:putative holliday junction resolvase
MKGRILAVDPGEKRIGLAVSDPTGTIANPYKVLNHISRVVDGAQIAQIAQEQAVICIVVGRSLDDNGEAGPSARKSQRLAEAIQAQTSLPIEYWDETGTTNEAQAARISMKVRRQKRSGHLDDLAAVILLQSYLDSQIAED